MDPNATLEEIRALSSKIVWETDMGRTPKPSDSARLAELTISLDEWLTNGGFLPNSWKR